MVTIFCSELSVLLSVYSNEAVNVVLTQNKPQCPSLQGTCHSAAQWLTEVFLATTMKLQWWKVAKYVHSTTVLKYSFVFYLSIYIFCYLILLLYTFLSQISYFTLHRIYQQMIGTIKLRLYFIYPSKKWWFPTICLWPPQMSTSCQQLRQIMVSPVNFSHGFSEIIIL